MKGSGSGQYSGGEHGAYAGRYVPLDHLPEKLRQKYPHSVCYSGAGYPDFSKYAKKTVKLKQRGGRVDITAAKNVGL